MVSAFRRRLAVGAIATFFASGLTFLMPGIAYAANYSFTVIGTGDGVGSCNTTMHRCTTLRAAFDFANDLTGTNMVSVDLPAGTYSLHQGELALTHGDLTFDLVGAGAATTIVTRASTAEDARILRVCAPSGVAGGCLATQTVHLSGITISNGRLVNDVGAGIENGAATMTLTDVTVHSNRIQVTNGTDTAPNRGVGAGIFNRGSLTLTNSTVSGNSISPDSNAPANLAAVGAGINSGAGSLTIDRTSVTGNTLSACADTCGVGSAGIQSRNSPLTIKDSTISGNTGTNGSGGVSTGGVTTGDAAAVTITNSTISGNSAPGSFGGGFWRFGPGIATLVNVTIANNSAPDGGGIVNSGPSSKLVLKNSIIANNTGGNCTGGVTSGGYNLDSANTCNLTGTGDLTDTDPKLGSLANNGGPTRTRALLAGSPAIDAVAATACPPPATDQRGVTRPQGPGCDMGAFEVVHHNTYTIGVDNASPTGHNNQYVDYFPRTGTTIHDGDVLDFTWSAGSLDGFHTATLLSSGEAFPSPAVYQEPNNQLVVSDSDDGAGKLQLNKSVLFPTDPTCGHSAAGACVYDGEGDLNSGAFPNTVPTGAPQPQFFVKVRLPVESSVTSSQIIHFVCLIHPFMAGSVTVVSDPTPTSTVASVAAASAAQKIADDAEVAPKIAAANASWTTNHVVTAGTASEHVEVLEMLPNTVSITTGTSVKWVTQTIRDVHTVTFPQGAGSNSVDPIPFMCEETGTTDSQPTGPPAPPSFGCSSPAVVEAHFIPGPQGATTIATTSTVGSSGILANPPAPYPNNYSFSFPNAGTFAYQCRIHDHMTGTVVASVAPPVLAQTGAPRPGVPLWVLLAGAFLFLLGLGLRRPFRIIR